MYKSMPKLFHKFLMFNILNALTDHSNMQVFFIMFCSLLVCSMKFPNFCWFGVIQNWAVECSNDIYTRIRHPPSLTNVIGIWTISKIIFPFQRGQWHQSMMLGFLGDWQLTRLQMLQPQTKNYKDLPQGILRARLYDYQLWKKRLL